MDNARVELLKAAWQACADEYADRIKAFTDLDTKAQSTTTIAGIFLAAALAFLQGDTVKRIAQLKRDDIVILLAVSIILSRATAHPKKVEHFLPCVSQMRDYRLAKSEACMLTNFYSGHLT